MKLEVKNDAVFMCCGKAKCPSIRKSNDSDENGARYYIISDDFGGNIKITEPQAFAMSEAAKKAKEITLK